MNLPNKLTLFRIFLTLPVIIIFSVFTWWTICVEKISFDQISLNSQSQYFLYGIGIIFILSMITDFFDGYLARKNNQITAFGKLFDPLADKILITTTLIFISIFNYTYVILVLIFIIRDLIVDGSRNLLASKNMKFEANIYGKMKTVFQTIAIPTILFFIPFINQKVWWELLLINIPMIIATIMSIISGILYFRQIIPIIKSDK